MFLFHEARPGRNSLKGSLSTCDRVSAPILAKGEPHMSATGLEVLDKSLQTTHIWLGEIMDELGPDREEAWHTLGAVLHALRDWIPVELAAHLGAQLPLLVRGLYYDQWRLSQRLERSRQQSEFIERVSEGLINRKPVNRVKAINAVFRVLTRHVSSGQAEKVRQALPEDIRSLWPVATAEPGDETPA